MSLGLASLAVWNTVGFKFPELESDFGTLMESIRVMAVSRLEVNNALWCPCCWCDRLGVLLVLKLT